jgi:hypothetical protein
MPGKEDAGSVAVSFGSINMPESAIQYPARLLSVSHRNVTDKRQVTSPLHRRGELALMKRAVSGYPARDKLAMFSHEGLHHAHILVIEDELVVRAEATHLFAVKTATTTATAAPAVPFLVITAVAAAISAAAVTATAGAIAFIARIRFYMSYCHLNSP